MVNNAVFVGVSIKHLHNSINESLGKHLIDK